VASASDIICENQTATGQDMVNIAIATTVRTFSRCDLFIFQLNERTDDLGLSFLFSYRIWVTLLWLWPNMVGMQSLASCLPARFIELSDDCLYPVSIGIW